MKHGLRSSSDVSHYFWLNMKRLVGCHQIELDQAALEKLLTVVADDGNTSRYHKTVESWHSGQSALASVNADKLSRDGISVSIIGNPFWRDSELTQLQKSSGNAAALLKAYQVSGRQCLDKIGGAFAFALMDRQKDRQIYAIDRMGIHGLYYHVDAQGQLVVASELASLRAFPHIGFDIDAQGIFNYLYFHMLPSPGTIYRKIHKLQPGQCLIVNAKGIDTPFYWNPKFDVDHSSGFSQLSDKLRSLLEAAVARCDIDDHSGAFLSGGLDSTTVVGVYSKLTPNARSFSIGFDAKGFDEIEYARISAKHFHSQLIEYYVTPADVADAVQKIAAYYEEPFGNASAIPTYYCAKLAKEHGVTKLLAGDGGDELFAGNARYAQQKVFELYFLLPAFLRQGVVEPLARSMPFGDSLWPIRKLRSYIQQANIRLPHRLQSYNFIDREGVSNIFHADFLASVDINDPALGYQDIYQRTQAPDKLNKMLFLDWKYTLADNDLRKVNHMCHLAGVDVCYPMLDEDLVAFSCVVPPAMKLKGVKLRHFYKKALADFLPPQTLTKSKHGFGLPFGVWLKNDPKLQELAFDNLSRIKSRGFFTPSFVDTLIQQHREGHANYYGDMIWAVMMLELWLDAH